MAPPSPARQGAAVDQAGGYAAGVTGSTIHNFRSYLLFLPSGVATDGSGSVYVGDIYNHRIQKFACP